MSWIKKNIRKTCFLWKKRVNYRFVNATVPSMVKQIEKISMVSFLR
jgi:hypothetical protein